MRPLDVLFFGTPELAAHMLRSLLADPCVRVRAVVTQPDRPRGRSGESCAPPVKEVAQEAGLPVYQPENPADPAFIESLRSFSADVFVVVAYGEIVKQAVLDIPRIACLNVHFSLLPLYRGAAPMQRALMDGVEETGCTIQHMVRKMDAGDVVAVCRQPVGMEMTLPELQEALTVSGTQLLREVLSRAARGETLVGTPQIHALATHAAKIEPEDCELDWQLDAHKIHNLVRATTPKPGAWCRVEIRDKPQRIKILRTSVAPATHGKPGDTLQFAKDGWIIACGSGAVKVLELQPDGKRVQAIDAFVAGCQGKPPRLHLHESP